ncbi:hypothetical protein JB92DRAFT_3127232 [Gautieria morchelliformis]|nr:hypothetical protein JB92DRAFT_3127232 [Gautieria morchelliformis]
MQPSDAELRAGAVAKLKRATSLPRIKGGRRPPMLPEPRAASEGERSRDGSSRHGDDSSKNVTSDEREDDQREPTDEPGRPVEAEQPEEHEHPESDQQPSSLPRVSPQRKRRSRSRSRSRSKDLKDLKPSKTPSPCSSSPEAKLDSLPAFDAIPVVSPTPSRPVAMPAGARLPFLPPTAPSSPPPPGAVPTLHDIQQRVGAGLLRSQSASRAAAMLKLTGASSNSEPPQPSPSPKPPSLSRSNTVTGSERAVARQRMIGRLQHRVGNQADELMTSGGEDIAPVPPKRRRRRSRRSSGTGSAAGASAIVDDREPTFTSPNTPIVPPSPLPIQQYPELPHPALTTPTLLSRAPLPPLPPPAPPSPPPEEERPVKVVESHPSPVALQQWTFQLGSPRRDDVVIEDDEEPSAAESELSLPQPSPSPPHTPPHDTPLGQADVNEHDRAREPHTSDAPSALTISPGHVVPVIMSADAVASPYKQDVFPQSPFNTPLKERTRDEEEEEEIVYREEMKARRVWSEKVVNGNGIKWPGDYAAEEPVIAVQDEEDEDGVKHGPNLPMRPSHRDLRTTATPSPNGAFCPSPSPSSGLAVSRSTPTRESADSSLGPSPALANFPNITGVFSQRPESITDIGTDYEEAHTDKATSKRTVDGNEKTTWAAKVKTFVVRSGSVTGRRSRTNSTTKREEKAVNRESGASGTSGKVEHASHGPPSTAPPSAWNSPAVSHAQLSQEHSRHLPMQTTSASTSLLSLSPVTPHRGGASPVPPPSPADLAKYSDAKLMPFPGLVKLDEERKRQRPRVMSVSGSVSSPNLPRDVVETVNPNSATDTEIRERKLSHQYSDSGLLQRYRNPAFGTETELFPTTSAQTATPSTSSSSWLPMSRKDVRKWYQANKFFNPLQSPSSSISTAMISLPIQDGNRSLGAESSAAVQQKFNNLLMHKPSSESTTDFEDSATNTSTTPKGRGKPRLADQDTMDLPADPFASPEVVSRVQSHQSSISSADSVYKRDSETEAEVASPGPPNTRPSLSINPEPVTSDRSWTPSASQTDSSLSYKPSDSPETPVRPPDRASVVLQRLDSLLSRDANDPNAWAFLEDPPRKLIMSSSVTQVIDSNTIRERFLFLFTDILVVAKPLEATHKAMDRSFIVKSIIDLNTVQVITNRDEGLSSPSRHPLVQQFVRDFGINADSAVTNLLQSSGLDEDQDALGKLLFNTFELDRTRLGGYLSKKSHKGVLKSYLDCFGFSGVRIDYALRTFILSIRLPTEAPEHAQEHLLNTFASKWFDANARAVSFDRDVAMKLVRILVQLDSQIHKASQGRPNGYDLRGLDFHAEWEAIVRAVDPRGLISDELIDSIYYSLREDPLRWAADAQYGRVYSIMFKRPPPNHLAHRVQSDPITLRIPHPDPHLRIQLHSQDGLTFDPPELNFARSTEVAFRVTGLSLGPKAIIFSLVGANAAFYIGIPFSKTVVIERHFMRNTFQVAFSDRQDRKRRYMFSAEDALVCHQWALSLRQPRPAKPAHDPGSDAVRQVQKATNALSLDILREAVAAQKLSVHDLIVICKQNSLLPTVLPNVTNVSNAPSYASMFLH